MGAKISILVRPRVIRWMGRVVDAYRAENPAGPPPPPMRKIVALGRGTKLGEVRAIAPDLDGFLAGQATACAADGLTRVCWEGLDVRAVVYRDAAGRPAVHRFDRQ